MNDYDPHATYAIVHDEVRIGDFYKQFDHLSGEFTFYPVKENDSNRKRLPGASSSEWRYGFIRPIEQPTKSK